MYMYEYMICICMRIQILGNTIKYPLNRPLDNQNQSTNKTNYASIVLVKNMKDAHWIDPWTIKNTQLIDNTSYQSNVKYVSAREHHNAQCQLHTKEKEVKWGESVVVCFDDISHLRNIQTYLWLHESTAMQMKFPNKSQPSHEEAGGEVANGDVQKHHHHDWLMWGGHPYQKCDDDLCHRSKLGHHFTWPYTS